MFLQREMRGCLRRCAVVLGVAALVCAVLAPTASAIEGRHYERVSPSDKGHGDIVGDGNTVVGSQVGDAVTFSSRTQFGDGIGSGVTGQTQYLARRTDDGWLTHSITPMSRPDALQTLLASTKVEVFSDDLDTALVWGYDLPGSTDDTPDQENLYVEDTATRSLRATTVSQVEPLLYTDFLDPNFWGLSADAKHVGLVTATQMLADAAPGVPNAYVWDDGVLHLAGVLPDGSVPSGGSTVEPMNYRGAISADGTRLAFTSPADGSPPQMYLRIDGRRTAWVSEPEGTDRSEPQGIHFEGMTPDGRNVFFVSDSPLLDDDTNPGPDLYRYTDSADPAGDPANLTLISHDGDAVNHPVFGGVLVGMSDDGSRVYYHSLNGGLSVWDHGVTKLINASVQRDFEPTRLLTLVSSRPGYGRVSPDGMWLSFLTNFTDSNDGVHGLTGEVTNGHFELYVYSLRANRLTCASCPSVDATSDVSVVPGVTSGLSIPYTANRPRFLSDNGRVFFSTAEKLLPEDVNGVVDTYEYDAATGALALLSTGKGSDPTTFADASASGDDVFLVTRQRLVKADQDKYVDMYDARVGPALPEPPVSDAAPCDGDGCQLPPTAAPADDLLGSASFDGGDIKAPAHVGITVRHRAVLHGATGSVPVKTSVAGRLKWSGTGLVQGSAKRGSAGSVRLTLRLRARARARLKRSGSYATTVRLTFRAADGTTATGSMRVTFRAVAKKGR